ncbi:B-4DMT family transporter [Nocardia cyriacigeorgica]|uniref:B-4DMT family transporter n=1 Tax=Nocardia cyriacigeorgica TaxID=135487 RepID=UPI0024560C55|nr:B-4DMT family transporter [Nocardia cyriacigeorgica]
MTAWVLRATVLGALVVALRVLLGFGMVNWPTQGSWMRLLCLAVIIAVVVGWGFLDGRRDRAAHPDADGGADLTIPWLKAAVAGGLGSGLVSWVLDLVPRFSLGDNGLLFEMTAGASFIVLLIFIPGLAGIAIGRRVGGKNGAATAGSHQPVAAAS